MTGERDGADTPDPGELSELLRYGPLRILGRMPWSSNATFLVEFEAAAGTGNGEPTDPGGTVPPAQVRGVYKPAAGERPLWDFPPGLWRREIATYELSTGLGLDLVPLTVHRVEGPFGEGSLQLFVPARFEEHYFTIRDDAHGELAEQLRLLCALDLIANSADRKSGHCLIDGADHIWAIDNGLTFHVEDKLRTVIWDFAGKPLPVRARKALEGLCETGPPSALVELLDRDEIAALLRRAESLLAAGRFPFDPSGRRYPWPLV